jgi:Fic family protein
VSYRTAIVEFYRRNPAATLEQVRRATGAPSATVKHVFRQLVAAGFLVRPRQQGTRDYLRAV